MKSAHQFRANPMPLQTVFKIPQYNSVFRNFENGCQNIFPRPGKQLRGMPSYKFLPDQTECEKNIGERIWPAAERDRP